MKLVIDINEYNKKWIGNLHFIPEELKVEIGDAIINGTPFDSVIEDIKAEILEEKECAYADFEQYKIDYLCVEPEYVEDELPYDDFRYGMERCVEIINSHINGKEQSE